MLLKISGIFQIHDSVTYSGRGEEQLLHTLGGKKHHSRIQARYCGFELFNELPNFIRSEKAISKYKKQINKLVQGYMEI